MKKSSGNKKSSKKAGKSPDKSNFPTDSNYQNKNPFPDPKPVKLTFSEDKNENEKNKEIENKEIEKLLENAETLPKYEFNLYKHLKENLKLRDKQCKDGLTKDSQYCFDCKISTCPKCSLYKIHNTHQLIKKYPYYLGDDNIINEHFTEIDKILNIHPDFLDCNKVKDELKKFINDNLNILQKKLNEIKVEKIKEIDRMFEKSEGCFETLKKMTAKVKNDLKSFFERQKKFYCIDISENQDINQNNPEANQVMENLKDELKSNVGMITTNKDRVNSTFLITYDLLANTKSVNDLIKYFINDIKLNREKIIKDFTTQKNQVYEDMQKLLSGFEGNINYQYLTNDFYKIIYDKIAKFNEQIDNMKRKIMDKVNRKGNFEDVEKEYKVSITHLNLKLENILSNQLIDEDQAKTIISKSKKTLKKKGSLGIKGGVFCPKSGTKPTLTNLDAEKYAPFPERIYNDFEEVKLDKSILQEYFDYEAFDVVNNNFKIKKQKKPEEIEFEFDEDIDLAKPIPGKSEIQVYDRKSMTIIKKNIKFEKSKHKYLNFLTGSRSVLIKDKLYIFGGVDKENKTTKVAWVYYLKENELKPMPDMIHSHAYHEVQFLDYYKSIVIIGGENCGNCEIYDMNTGQWKDLPDLNIPRANCISYLDKITHKLYAFFGIMGKISERNNNFSDALECLDFRKLALGWYKVDYNNRADISFRTGINQLLSLNPEMILVYGGSSMREFIKKAAVYVLPKQEMVKIDNRMFDEIREASKKSKKLSKILTNIE